MCSNQCNKKGDCNLPSVADAIAICRSTMNAVKGMVLNRPYTCNTADLIMLGLIDICMEHVDATVHLMEKELYGSASALTRLSYEALIKAHWIHGCASESKVEQIRKGAEYPRFGHGSDREEVPQ
jgi:hypothetical protein